jgi:AI-2 transport protein TqsA
MNQSLAKINTACLLILAAAVFTTGLVYMRVVLEPLVFALFYYAVALPFVTWFETRLKFPRIVAVLITTLAAGIISALVIYLITQSIGDFVREADAYKERTVEFTAQLTDFLNRNGISIEQDKIREEVRKLPIFDMLGGMTSGAVNLFGNFFLILVIFLFLIIGGSPQAFKTPLQIEIEGKVSRYVITKAILSIATGIFAGVILGGFGVELAAMFAVLTFLLNFIPNIGSVIATLLPIPVILLQFGFGVHLLAVTTLLGAVQLTIGNILEPKLMGESLDLHPVTILIFLLFWGLVWGIAGMFLAVPITAIMKIILSKIEFTKPLADAMSGKVFI